MSRNPTLTIPLDSATFSSVCSATVPSHVTSLVLTLLPGDRLRTEGTACTACISTGLRSVRTHPNNNRKDTSGKFI